MACICQGYDSISLSLVTSKLELRMQIIYRHKDGEVVDVKIPVGRKFSNCSNSVALQIRMPPGELLDLVSQTEFHKQKVFFAPVCVERHGESNREPGAVPYGCAG